MFLVHLTGTYLFRVFYELSEQKFFIRTENNAIYKHYKYGRYDQLTGIGKHSATLEEMLLYKELYASVDFSEGKFGADRSRGGKKQKAGKHDFKIK